jgi:hypothetical protein
MLPLLALIFFLGFIPNVLTQPLQQPVGEILGRYAPTASSAIYEQPIETHTYRSTTIEIGHTYVLHAASSAPSSAREQARGGA